MMHADIGRLVAFFLLGNEDVTDLVGREVYTVMPTTTTYPVVRVSQLGGATGDHRWVGRTLLQIDCWGPGSNDRRVAHRLAETCANALTDLRDLVTYGDETAVITSVDVGMVHDDFDNEHTPARPRARVSAVVYATPAP